MLGLVSINAVAAPDQSSLRPFIVQKNSSRENPSGTGDRADSASYMAGLSVRRSQLPGMSSETGHVLFVPVRGARFQILGVAGVLLY